MAAGGQGGRGAGGGPIPPPPQSGRRPTGAGAKPVDTSEHAAEVKAVTRGKDIVERPERRDAKPAAFDRKEMLVARTWFERRPLETGGAAAPMVEFPRMWNTKRGRYCHFKAPGAGNYGILRARPTF